MTDKGKLFALMPEESLAPQIHATSGTPQELAY